MKKLTPRMIEHLSALSGGERSSYPGLSIGTLNVLLDRRLVNASFGPGSIIFPQNTIKWRLTDKGREALSQPLSDA